jgi:hypothetical protein
MLGRTYVPIGRHVQAEFRHQRGPLTALYFSPSEIRARDGLYNESIATSG